MYLINKILVDNDKYCSSEIIDYTHSGVKNGLIKLEQSVRELIRDLSGKLAAQELNIINVHSLDQVAEPILDSILIYRVDVDPHKLHIYQKTSKTLPSYLWGNSITSVFKKIIIVELQHCEIITTSDKKSSEKVISEMVQYGPAKIAIPKILTVSPMCDVLNSLKTCNMFLAIQKKNADQFNKN